MRRTLILLLIFCAPFLGGAQNALTEVKGLPTKEIYDLLVDKKGFLWVGHDMGISRYDGVSFTHFAHPKRSSLSITDLVEDRFGRVWFHNFTGQIFYVENEQIHLLEAYKNEEEDYFPRMVMCEDELVVTSRFGLFVCDTRSLKGRYVKNEGAGRSSTKSIALVGNEVLAFDSDEWYSYSSRKGLETLENNPVLLNKTRNKHVSLQPVGSGDTAFLIINPTGLVVKVVRKGSTVKQVGEINAADFINSVTRDNGKFWLHLKNESLQIGNKEPQTLSQNNLSDAVTDHQGNLWCSSLGGGLLLLPAKSNIELVNVPFLEAGDAIFSFERMGSHVLVGTKFGRLYLADSRLSAAAFAPQLSAGMGSIGLLKTIDEKNILVAASSGSFLFNRQNHEVRPYSDFIIKNAELCNGRLLLASATGLYSFPYDCVSSLDNQFVVTSLPDWHKAWQSTMQPQNTVPCNKLFWYRHRCRSVAYFASEKMVYASFMSGVYHMGANEPRPLIVDGEKVYANSMVAHGKQLFIGTLNKGLMIKEGQRFRMIGTAQGLFSNSIVSLKQQGRYLWIFQDKAIQVLDLKSSTLVNAIELPQESGANVHDVISFGDTALLSTNDGIYRILLGPPPSHRVINCYLQAMLISSSGQLGTAKTDLRHNENNIQFNLSTPFYSPSDFVYFKYRLKGSIRDDQWFATAQGERMVRFAALKPGTYTFEAVAVVGGSQESRPVTFSFTINRPWWQTGPFILAMVCLLALAFYGIYRYRLRQVLKIERVRRSISSDLHDEIGSTLSSINIYAAMARGEGENKEYLDLIQHNIREVISKLDDLVWSINPKNDTVVQLVSRMRSFAEPLLKGAGIGCSFEINESLLSQELPLVTKRNLYLIFKELVNNVVKHSRARNCRLQLDWANGHISMVVADDGVGLDLKRQPKERHGMENLVSRTRSMKAFIYFQEDGGPGTSVRVMVPVKIT